ncbi:hypothetical protein BMS3Bbin05_01641 [bacterium BMS3Bbin05]|nr:hypothetical protein BMS3Bbin05_01641 [bacterium BMS3Bbin05]
MDKDKRIEAVLAISFAALITFPLLYILRFLDNNTLVSWKWAFSSSSLSGIYTAIIIGLMIAFLASRISIHKYYIPVLLFLSFAAVLPLWAEPEMILDTSRYFVQAKFLEIYGIKYFLAEWGKDINAWTDMPLVPFIYGLIFRYIGESRTWIQLFNTSIFTLTVLVTFLLGKELWDRDAGFSAAISLLGIPYLLIQVPLMLVDTITMFLVTLSIFMYVKALKNGGALMIGSASASVVLALLSKYSVLLMLPVLPIITFVYRKNPPKKIYLRSGMVMVPAVFLFAIIFFLNSDVFLGQINILSTYQWPALGRWQEDFVSTFLFQSNPFLLVFALAGGYLAIRNRDRKFLIPIWFFIFIIIFQVKRIRYIIPLFPLFTLMTARGLKVLESEQVRRYAELSIVTLSLVVLYGGFSPFLNNTSMENLKLAGRYLDSMPGAAIEVYTLPQAKSAGNTDITVPILDLYTGKSLLFRQRVDALSQAKNIKELPLRFTWEFGIPDFYSHGRPPDKGPFVLIAGEKLSRSSVLKCDDGRHMNLKAFERQSGAFRYRTFVYICD